MVSQKLPKGNQFIGRWEALKKRLDEMNDNMPDRSDLLMPKE